MSASVDLEAVRRELLALREGQRSVVLASVGADGGPEASYAPYLYRDGAFYLFLSGLARHSANLRRSGRVSLLFLEPEAETRQIFARRRLSYDCEAERVPRQAAEWEPVLTAFTQRFGPVMDTLRELADFELFRLRPRRGQYVRGFGQAFRLGGEGLDRPEQVVAPARGPE